MRIGVNVFLTDYSIDVSVLAKRAEELGYDSFWVPEHPVIPVNATTAFPFSSDGSIPKLYGEIVDPFVALARASAVTSSIKLGTGVCLVPEHNPLLLAKEVATLDYFSGGRFIFGIGAGWLREETEVMGGDFDHRWRQTREGIKAMKELWTKEESDHHGKTYDFPPVLSFPKPAQKPHPPIFIGAWAPRNVFKRVVEWGDGWMPTRADPEEIRYGRNKLDELAAQAGRDPRSIHIAAISAPADREAINALEEAGADTMVIRLATAGEKESLLELEEVARRVL